ncbi:MAG: amidohydrolase family protein [Bryobacteraceae bacterium]|jgi:imidazolonepropionase-like amidohydrolase
MRKLVAALLLPWAWAIAENPRTLAIRNAKIVTVSGPVVNKGTVVVRNGLIEAVGENAPIPAGAWTIDGEGMTIYPGLIDSLSTVGIPSLAPAAGRGGRGQAAASPTPATTPATAVAPAAPPAKGPEDRPATTSWVLAADEIDPSDRRIESVRSAGFTTAVTFPARGIFGGQGSIIDLVSAERAGEMVVVPAVGQYLAVSRGGTAFGGFGAGFPNALMGYIAYIRQVYLDAEHYKLVKEAYARDPRGMERPEYDRALEGVLESKRILLPANRLVEMDRMLRFAAELKQPVILYGMREAYRAEAAPLLKKYGSPVLVSLHWSEPPRDPDPEAERTMRSLEDVDQGPAAPSLLQKAGVPFALYSDGLDQPRDLQRAVKKAIDAGLARQDAIRALTLSPAEIYGVADRMGSIAVGKIANLVVTKGDLFDDHTQIEMIFVDGKQYKPAAEQPADGGRGANEEPGVSQ